MSACEWWSLRSALAHFVTFRGSTQSQRHIKPLHWYVACRLVVEGGFDPDEIMPRPPFRVTRKAGQLVLVHDPSAGGGGERTVYGGLKTKSVDVVVTKEGIGPVLAVSCKGAIGAAIAFALASTEPERKGQIIDGFPGPGGALRFDRFFDSLYRQYDERFVYAAPDLRKVTARKEWDAASPAFDAGTLADLDYEPRASS